MLSNKVLAQRKIKWKTFFFIFCLCKYMLRWLASWRRIRWKVGWRRGDRRCCRWKRHRSPHASTRVPSECRRRRARRSEAESASAWQWQMRKPGYYITYIVSKLSRNFSAFIRSPQKTFPSFEEEKIVSIFKIIADKMPSKYFLRYFFGGFREHQVEPWQAMQ